MSGRTIQVTGRGVVRLAPDVVTLTFSVSARDADYAAAAHTAEADGAKVKEALEKSGVAAVRAAGLRTEPWTETVTEAGVTRRRQAGYLATRRISARLSPDPALLANVLAAVTACGASPELSAEYALADADKAKKKAAARAVKDAKERANAIAKAAGVKLGGVRSIECGAAGVPVMRAMAMRADRLSDLAPEQIEVCEDVTVLFDIGE